VKKLVLGITTLLILLTGNQKEAQANPAVWVKKCIDNNACFWVLSSGATYVGQSALDSYQSSQRQQQQEYFRQNYNNPYRTYPFTSHQYQQQQEYLRNQRRNRCLTAQCVLQN
jgi:hypothetical protein